VQVHTGLPTPSIVAIVYINPVRAFRANRVALGFTPATGRSGKR
jgi:hypothetical protein